MNIVSKSILALATKRLRKSPRPLEIAARSTPILLGVAVYESALERARSVDSKLLALASVKAAATVGCSW